MDPGVIGVDQAGRVPCRLEWEVCVAQGTGLKAALAEATEEYGASVRESFRLWDDELTFSVARVRPSSANPAEPTLHVTWLEWVIEPCPGTLRNVSTAAAIDAAAMARAPPAIRRHRAAAPGRWWHRTDDEIATFAEGVLDYTRTFLPAGNASIELRRQLGSSGPWTARVSGPRGASPVVKTSPGWSTPLTAFAHLTARPPLYLDQGLPDPRLRTAAG